MKDLCASASHLAVLVFFKKTSQIHFSIFTVPIQGELVHFCRMHTDIDPIALSFCCIGMML